MDNLVLYRRIADYDKYLRTYIIVNIPNIHRDIRIRFLDELYSLLRNMYLTLYTKGNVRIKHLTEMQVSVSLLDYLTNKIIDMDIVKKKYINTSIDKLADIKNIIFAWKKNEENRK